MKKLLTLLLLGALSAPTYAHQLKSAITTVLFNGNSKNLEVMHRFYLHDAEHAVGKLVKGKKGSDIYTDEETQQIFANYVIDRFKLIKDGNQELTLDTIGFETEGKFFWVYQETAMPEKIASLKVKHGALQDIWPEQVNTVNIEGEINGSKTLKTLTFNGSGELLETEL